MADQIFVCNQFSAASNTQLKHNRQVLQTTTHVICVGHSSGRNGLLAHSQLTSPFRGLPPLQVRVHSELRVGCVGVNARKSEITVICRCPEMLQRQREVSSLVACISSHTCLHIKHTLNAEMQPSHLCLWWQQEGRDNLGFRMNDWALQNQVLQLGEGSQIKRRAIEDEGVCPWWHVDHQPLQLTLLAVFPLSLSCSWSAQPWAMQCVS